MYPNRGPLLRRGLSFKSEFSRLRTGIRYRSRFFKKHKLAICAIFRDESSYLDEWIRFHHNAGVEKFYLINHKSQDNYLEVLAPWIENGIVQLIQASSDDQVHEYNLALRKFGHTTRWLALIDIDEFLFSPANQGLVTSLRAYEKHAAVFVYWRLFGSGGRRDRVPDELGLLRGFQLCIPPARNMVELQEQRALHRLIKADTKLTGAPIQGKVIIRPARVREVKNHWLVDFDGQVCDENLNTSKLHFPGTELDSVPSSHILRINHYWSRSLTELRVKATREPVHRGLRNRGDLRAVPAKLAEEWDKELGRSLDNAILEYQGVDLPFVFLIGFNKTATRSFHDFFAKNGFPAVHWHGNRLVSTMLDNQIKGQRLLVGYEQFRVFSDFTYSTDTSVFEGNRLFRELYRDYPSAYFILNNRATEDWISSRLAHNDGLFARRHLAARGLADLAELSRVWSEEKTEHESAVREFFKTNPRFREIDISSLDVPGQIGTLMNRSFEYRAWENVRSLHSPVTPFTVAGL